MSRFFLFKGGGNPQAPDTVLVQICRLFIFPHPLISFFITFILRPEGHALCVRAVIAVRRVRETALLSPGWRFTLGRFASPAPAAQCLLLSPEPVMAFSLLTRPTFHCRAFESVGSSGRDRGSAP